MFKKSSALFLAIFVALGSARAEEVKVEAGGSLPVDGAIVQQVNQVIDKDSLCSRYIAGVQSAALAAPLQKYTGGKPSCVRDQESADMVCRDSTSPELASTVSKVNMALSMLGSVAVKDACSNFAKIMDIAKAGLSAYTATCGALKANCSSSCVKTEAALINLQKLLNKETGAATMRMECNPQTPQYGDCMICQNYILTERHVWIQKTITTIAQELNKTETKSISGKVTLCVGKYAELLTSAGMGILSVANSIKQGQDCGKATDGSGTTGPDLANLDIKCAMAEYKNTTECICHLNPRQTGCANSLEKTNGGSGYSGMSAGTGSGGAGSSGGSVTLPTGSESTMPEIASKSAGAGGAGAPVGGGSGIGGGGSAGGNSGGAGGEDGHKGLNTNILSGSGGGGGGGWGGGSRSAADEKYRPYLPGGAKDPQRGVAGQGVSNEVTGQGGKSNWEKVRDRYRDNNSTLLNN